MILFQLVLSFFLLVSLAAAQVATDCKWDCNALDGEALQTFASFTGPSNNNGDDVKIEIARLDIQTGNYISLAKYPSLENINAAVYWRDNVTHPGEVWDKIFVAEGRTVGGVRKHYLVQLCQSDDQFFRRAVLPPKSTGQMYYVASTSNDGKVWLSGGGTKDIVNVDFASVATTDIGTPGAYDTSSYSKFTMSGPGLNDLAWYEPCQIFVGISARGTTVSDSAVMLFDYDTATATSFTFPEGIDGPQGKHLGFGACYTFMEGNEILCSGNGNSAEGITGALYSIAMNETTCEPENVRFRVPSQPGSANDGTTCRFPGTLPCIPSIILTGSQGHVDECGLSRVMEANTPSGGGYGQWTQIPVPGDVSCSFDDPSDPNAEATASAAGTATLLWTLFDPLCPEQSSNITVSFGSAAGCCAANEYVDDHECTPCPVPYVNGAGDDPDGEDTSCVWPVCPAHSVYVNGVCRCVTGYTNDPEWTGVIWTNTCKKICKFCTS